MPNYNSIINNNIHRVQVKPLLDKNMNSPVGCTILDINLIDFKTIKRQQIFEASIYFKYLL